MSVIADRRAPVASIAQRRIAGLLTRGGGPTPDLYFANACAEALRRGAVRRLSPTVFESERAVLVMRHSGGAAIDGPLQGKRLIWFCDDAVLSQAALPIKYRTKLALTDAWAARRIGARADALVISSRGLRGTARLLAPGAPISIIDPYWSDAPNPLDHFDDRAFVDIAYLGASSHRADFRFLAPVLSAVLEARPNARVHLPGSHQTPRALRRHPRVRIMSACKWPAWRAGLPERRFHILLYPLTGTPFNRGRSVNKLIEHGLTGGASVFSSEWAEAGRAEGAAVLAPTTRAAWVEAVISLIDDAARMRDVAEAGRRRAEALNQPGPQRRLWADQLGLTGL